MIRYLCNGALAAALLGAAFAAAASPSRVEYKPQQVILMKEQGKPDRRCVIVSAKKHSDGLITYQVKALDNSEIITIYDRPPASEKQSVANPGSKNGDKPPADFANRAEANLPRAKPRADDPLLNPRANEPLLNPSGKPRSDDPPTSDSRQSRVAQPKPTPQPEPEKHRFRLFARNEKPATQKTAKANPGSAHSTEEPPLAQVAQEPLPIAGGPRVPMSVPATRLEVDEPAPMARSSQQIPVSRPVIDEPAPMTRSNERMPPSRAIVNVPASTRPNQQMPRPRSAASEPVSMANYQAPLDPAQRAQELEKERFEDLRDALKYALRPSERMAAAEALCAPTRITDPENRAAVMLSAQDDPAGVVRAACIRGMSRSGVRDQAFIALLVGCQNDREPIVRVEANLAMQKATRR